MAKCDKTMTVNIEHPGVMSRERMVGAFNEWMRQYTESPEAFEREFQSVARFLAEGPNATYGDTCAALMFRLADGFGVADFVADDPSQPPAGVE